MTRQEKERRKERRKEERNDETRERRKEGRKEGRRERLIKLVCSFTFKSFDMIYLVIML